MSQVDTPENKIVLVTGATGAVGPRVVHALDQAGCRIRSFSVDNPAVGMFPQSVEVLIGDVTDQAAVQSAMQGVDAVVHLAALALLAMQYSKDFYQRKSTKSESSHVMKRNRTKCAMPCGIRR